MERIVKIVVEIDCDNSDFEWKVSFHDMKFTSYESLFDFDFLKDKLLKAYKHAGSSWKVITMEAFWYDHNSFGLNQTYHFIKGRRYVNEYGQIKRAAFDGNTYKNWIELPLGTGSKEIKEKLLTDMKESVNSSNTKFIELVKKS